MPEHPFLFRLQLPGCLGLSLQNSVSKNYALPALSELPFVSKKTQMIYFFQSKCNPKHHFNPVGKESFW